MKVFVKNVFSSPEWYPYRKIIETVKGTIKIRDNRKEEDDKKEN